MRAKCLGVVVLLLIAGCTQKTLRCDGALRPINIPSLPVTVTSP